LPDRAEPGERAAMMTKVGGEHAAASAHDRHAEAMRFHADRVGSCGQTRKFGYKVEMSRLKIRGTEVAISRIGFGCARVYGGHETKASARLIEAALTAGIEPRNSPSS
jgi:hypothetical protein